MTRALQLALGFLLMLATLVWAAEDGLRPSNNLPIEVTAQRLEALRDQRQAVFTGNVVARQGDMTLYCQKLVLYSTETDQKVERLEAFGEVRIVEKDRTGMAERAVYNREEGVLELIGRAELHQGQNKVSGDEITLYLNENRSVVKSQDQGRIKAILIPRAASEEP